MPVCQPVQCVLFNCLIVGGTYWEYLSFRSNLKGIYQKKKLEATNNTRPDTVGVLEQHYPNRQKETKATRYTIRSIEIELGKIITCFVINMAYSWDNRVDFVVRYMYGKWFLSDFYYSQFFFFSFFVEYINITGTHSTLSMTVTINESYIIENIQMEILLKAHKVLLKVIQNR